MGRKKNEIPTVIFNVRIAQEARDKLVLVDKYKTGKYISDLIIGNEIKEQFKAKK